MGKATIICLVLVFGFVGLGSAGGVSASAMTECHGTLCHNVQKDDSLSKIARQYGVSLDALIRANPKVKNRHLIKPGWAIRLPKNQNQAQKIETGRVEDAKGLERPNDGRRQAPALPAAAATATQEFSKEAAWLAQERAELRAELRRAHQEIDRLTTENEILRKERPPQRLSAMSVASDDMLPPIENQILLFISVLCAGGMALLFVKLRRSNNNIAPSSRSKPPPEEEVPKEEEEEEEEVPEEWALIYKQAKIMW